MKTYILPLSDPQANLETVGGKGMSLARLVNAGIPVPNGFHITTAAYQQFVDENNLGTGIRQALEKIDTTCPETLETASRKIKELFGQAIIPAPLVETILKSYGDLPGGLPAVAVRSSATAEDLPEASFAGQQDTYLNITGPQQLLEAVQKCWTSLWTARAIGYRARQGIHAEGVALAVVVQLMVNAEAAGILFTANPISGKRDEIIINASWGLGEAVVGGTVTPDALTLDKATGKIIRRETAKKLIMTVRTADGTEEENVPVAMQERPVLSDTQAAELVRISREIEDLYQMPMDIEWAYADEEFAILQARPITAIADAPFDWSPPDPKGTYMRTSVIDLMPKPLTPLFNTLYLPAHRAQMAPASEQMIGSKAVLTEDFITTINQYAYVNSYYPPRVLWWVLTKLLPAYPKFLGKLVPLWREEIHPAYQTTVASKQGIDPANYSIKQLWNEIQELVDAAAYYICSLMFATMGASAGSEGLLTMAYNKFAKQNGDPDASVLLMGWNNIPIRSEKSLYDLAQWIKTNPTLQTYVLDTPTDILTDQLTAESLPANAVHIETDTWEIFSRRFQSHLDQYGHIIFQLDFAEPLPCDHPEMMLENIKMYLRGEGSDPHERQQESEQERITTTEIMLNRLKGLKRWLFAKALNWGQTMAEVREDALADIGLAYPLIRAFLLELGQRLSTNDLIQQPEDIFYLEQEEITNCITLLEQGQKPDDFSKLVDERKAFFHRAAQITPPPMFPVKKRVMGIKTEAFIAASGNEQNGNLLKGVAASAGNVTAPARILHGPEDFSHMQFGDILVASTTTPAWTPLFAMASAVVTDIGGPLSHGSIVAREYDIPAVMGTGNATKRIQNGQMITVDGSAGTVELLPES